VISVDEGLTPPSLSSLPSLTCVHTICPFWTPGPIPGFEIEPILPVLDTTETTDSRVPTGTDLPVLDTGRKPIPGFEIEPGLSPVTKPGFGWNLNYASGRNFEPCTSPNNNAVPDFVE